MLILIEDKGTDDSITPNLDVLAEGPPALGYTKFPTVAIGGQHRNRKVVYRVGYSLYAHTITNGMLVIGYNQH